MDDLWRNVGVIAGTLTSVCLLAGLAVRFILVPYLREHLVKPVQETARQVTPTSDPRPHEPTMVDRLDDVAESVRRLSDTTVAVQAIANAAARSTAGAHRRLDRHENWADHEVSRLWSEVRKPAHSADADKERDST